jgi:pentatricopeptide repeat protein
MSEMLGNQYFMARNFSKALHQYELMLQEDPDDHKIQKKLIICYCEMGMVKEALNLFDQLTDENIEIIAKTDLIKEDCPCPELVERMRWYEQITTSSFDYYCILGILNLYCNLADSVFYFSKTRELSPQDEQINRIFKRIVEYSTQEHSPV